MRLYKNVDIKDLESILEKGILSMDVCGNNNWESGHRAPNATNVVYLFKPLSFKRNYFSRYGQALIECEVDDAKENEFLPQDSNKGSYVEYITSEVKQQNITAVYIPKEFKGQVTIHSDLIQYVDYTSALNSTLSGKDNLDLNQYAVKQMKLVSQDIKVKLFKHVGYITKSKIFEYNGKQVAIAKKYKLTDEMKYSYKDCSYDARAYLIEKSAPECLENTCDIYRAVDKGGLFEAAFTESDQEVIENAFISLLNKNGQKIPKHWDLKILIGCNLLFKWYNSYPHVLAFAIADLASLGIFAFT